jgi:pimeloyl-ACP methyl ester carboxylesterase
VQRLVAEFARVYAYDRLGCGRSKASPESSQPPTAAQRCADLTHLLEAANIDPLWMLVDHSYGGVLVREFLATHGAEIVKGLVIVDSAIERMPLPLNWSTLLGDVMYQEVVGLEESRRGCVIDEEWQRIKEDDEGNVATAAEEERWMGESTRVVNAKVQGKRLLGGERLSVIFAKESVDFGKVRGWGVRHGSRTAEAGVVLRKRLDDMSEIDEKGQRTHLTLSSQSRFVYEGGLAKTHNLQFVQPLLVAEEVRWVLGVEKN